MKRYIPTKMLPTGAPMPLLRQRETLSKWRHHSFKSTPVATTAFHNRAPSRCNPSPFALAKVAIFLSSQVSLYVNAYSTCFCAYWISWMGIMLPFKVFSKQISLVSAQWISGSTICRCIWSTVRYLADPSGDTGMLARLASRSPDDTMEWTYVPAPVW